MRCLFRGTLPLHDRTPGRTATAIAVMLVTPLFFSTNLIFGRSVIAEVAPFTLAFIRWAAVALVLSPFLLAERSRAVEAVRTEGKLILLIGFLGMWICGALVYVALSMTSATNGTLIYTTSPVLILIVEALFLGRSIGARAMVGSLLAFAGVAVIVLEGDLARLAALDFNLGDLIFVGAAIAWAVYSILYRSPGLRAVSNLALFCLVAASGAALLAPFALFELLSGAPMPDTLVAWGGIAGIVFFSSLLAFSGFQYGVRTLGAAAAGIFMYLLPPYGVFLAVMFLGETFHPYHEAGIALVMGGIVIATFPVALLRAKRV